MRGCGTNISATVKCDSDRLCWICCLRELENKQRELLDAAHLTSHNLNPIEIAVDKAWEKMVY